MTPSRLWTVWVLATYRQRVCFAGRAGDVIAERW